MSEYISDEELAEMHSTIAALQAENTTLREVALGYRQTLKSILDGDLGLAPERNGIMRRLFIKSALSVQIPEGTTK